MDENGDVKFFMKIQKKKKLRGGGWVGVGEVGVARFGVGG